MMDLKLKLAKKDLELRKAQGSITKAEAAKEKTALEKEKFQAKQTAFFDKAKNQQRLTTLAAFFAHKVKKHWNKKSNRS